MKKLLILILSVGVIQSAVAQEIAIGIKGGLNFANINPSQSLGTTYNSRTGYHFGAFTLFKLSKIGIQPEVLFSKQGTKYTVSTQNVDANFDYINIPVILKIYLAAGLNLQVGPQIGFVSGGDIKTTVSGVTNTQSAKDFVKGSDTSIALGAGWDLPFGLNIDARYNLGVSSNSINGSSTTFKNQVFQISAGFKLIKLGK
jgi:hypothetical protein